MYEKFRLYLALIEFPVFLIDILRIFLCVFSINQLSSDDSVFKDNNSKPNSNYSICANYILLLIDCLLFYFIKFNKITLILLLRIIYLLICVSLLMVLINQPIQQSIVNKNCCSPKLQFNKNDYELIKNIDQLQVSSTNNLIVNQANGKRNRTKKRKPRLLDHQIAKNCSNQLRLPNFQDKLIDNHDDKMLNLALNKTLIIDNIGGYLLNQDQFNIQLYFKYTEIILIALSMIVYSLTIFTVDIYFFQIPND